MSKSPARICEFGTAPEQKKDGYMLIGTVCGTDAIAGDFFGDVRLVRGAGLTDGPGRYEFWVMVRSPEAVLELQRTPAVAEERPVAHHVAEISVVDPDSGAPVDLSVYKDATSGGLFAVDSSFLITLDDDDPVIEPFNGREVSLIDGPFGVEPTHDLSP